MLKQLVKGQLTLKKEDHCAVHLADRRFLVQERRVQISQAIALAICLAWHESCLLQSGRIVRDPNNAPPSKPTSSAASSPPSSKRRLALALVTAGRVCKYRAVALQSADAIVARRRTVLWLYHQKSAGNIQKK